MILFIIGVFDFLLKMAPLLFDFLVKIARDDDWTELPSG